MTNAVFTQIDAAGLLGKLLPTGTTASAFATISDTRGVASGASAGSSAFSIRHAGGASSIALLAFEVVPEGVQKTAWEAGDWTVRLNVSSANTNFTVTAIEIYRVDRWSGTLRSKIGALAGVSVALSAGTKTGTVTTVSSTGGIDDIAYVLFVGSIGSTGTQTLGVTPSLNIDSSIVDTRSFDLSPPVMGSSMPLLVRGDTLAVSLNDAASATLSVLDVGKLSGSIKALTPATSGATPVNVTALSLLSYALTPATSKLTPPRAAVTTRGVTISYAELEVEEPGAEEIEVSVG